MTAMLQQNARRRIQVTPIASGWSGASPLTMGVPESEGLTQHQLSMACSSLPASGVIRVMARPLKASYFVQVIDVSVVNAGTALVIFPGLIDAIKLIAETALPSGVTVDASLASCGEDFGLATLKVLT